jgi:multidrug efflux system membrane fusion protein
MHLSYHAADMTDSIAPPSAAQGDHRRGHRWIYWALGLILLVLAVWLLSKWLGAPKPAAKPAATIPVAVTAVKRGDINVYLDELGTVTPVYTVTVASRVAGELTQVRYREGQIVKKNDLLAVIDPRPYAAALAQAQGQLARDQALLDNARLDLVRYQNSYAEHAIPEQQLATQKALVDQDAGTVKLDQGNLDAAKVNVDYTRIVSPIDGRVGLRSVDPGNIVPANGTTGIVTITQLQPITVIFTIAEDNLDAVVEQMAAGHTLAVDALDRTQQRKLASGTLLTIDNQINVATGTVRARASFANTRNELFPNQFVNARLLVKTLSQVDLVPNAAIQRNGDAAFVYIVQADGTVKTVDIKIQTTDGKQSAVTGVEPGQQLVTDGFDKLQNGTKVTIKPAPVSPPSPVAGEARSGEVKRAG